MCLNLKNFSKNCKGLPVPSFLTTPDEKVRTRYLKISTSVCVSSVLLLCNDEIGGGSTKADVRRKAPELRGAFKFKGLLKKRLLRPCNRDVSVVKNVYVYRVITLRNDCIFSFLW